MLNHKKNVVILITNFIFLCISFALLIYMMIFHQSGYQLFVILLEAILFIFYFYLSLVYALKLKKMNEVNMSLEQACLHNKVLQTLYDDVRTFKHDFFNIMQSINGYIKAGNIIALENYYHEINLECTNVNSLSALDPNLIDDPALYSLIVSKYNRAKDLGIAFDMHILVKFSSLPANPYLICRVLGILLDNAIEAANNSTDKKIIFELIPIASFDPSKKMANVVIENSYANKDVDLNRICEKGFTSKPKDGKSHGLGLWKVNDLLKKQEHLTLRTSKDDSLFKQVLEIY